MKLPESILAAIGPRQAERDRIGRSSSQVLLYPDLVLKVSAAGEGSEHEHTMLRWLKGRLPVPEVVCHAVENGQDWLLMTRMEGRMACDEFYMNRPGLLIEKMAEAVRMLWAVPIGDCPFRCMLDEKLAMARRAVESGEVKPEDAQPETFGPGGFRDPEALLLWLEENRPAEREIFSHGDLCMPNVLFTDAGGIGFLDLGNSGVCDPWNDLSICMRSLHNNFEGVYDGKRYAGLRLDDLLSALEVRPEPEEIRYYTLLDELF